MREQVDELSQVCAATLGVESLDRGEDRPVAFGSEVRRLQALEGGSGIGGMLQRAEDRALELGARGTSRELATRPRDESCREANTSDRPGGAELFARRALHPLPHPLVDVLAPVAHRAPRDLDEGRAAAARAPALERALGDADEGRGLALVEEGF